MAYKAPTPMREDQLRISKKALEGYRDLTGSQHIARPDWDVKKLLAERLITMTPLHVVTDVNHPDQLTHVYAIDEGEETRYAVVRDLCCVTLLSHMMVAKNLRGTWVHATDDSVEPARIDEGIVPAPPRKTEPAPPLLPVDQALPEYYSPIPLDLAALAVIYAEANIVRVRIDREVARVRAELAHLEYVQQEAMNCEVARREDLERGVVTAVEQGRDR